MFEKLRQMFSTKDRDAELAKHLEELRDKTPVPVVWLFGKTQTGKTSIVKYLTGAEEAEIGAGFRSCTKFSQRYDFPNEEAPVLSFLDTRGLEEPGYEPTEDIERFDDLAHVILVTVKALDHAQESQVTHLKKIHARKRDRPIILVATCLHEAYPQQQHPTPYEKVAWQADGDAEASDKIAVPEDLHASLEEQRQRYEGLYDYFVAIDLTKSEEGFDEPDYGGEHLKRVILEALPSAYRQTLITLDRATGELSDLYAKHALPHIAGYSSMAATAGAIPIPLVDMFIVPGIQTRMIYSLAKFYGQPLTGERFLELAGTLGMGMIVRTATRQLMKFIPYVGSVAGAALAGASTFALGKAFCYYYSAVHRGQVPQPEDLKKYYQEQLAQAEKVWRRKKEFVKDDRTD